MSPRECRHREVALRTSGPYPCSRPSLRALLPYLSASRPSVLLTVSSFGPSSLARLLWPLLTSDSASEDLAIFVAQQHAVRSPRVLRTDLHAYARRIYVAACRTRIGLCIFWPAHPAALASIRFLFVAPALCFRLPSDLESPQAPLPSANTSSCQACRGLPPPRECALPGAPKESPARGGAFGSSL
jgi:hypothetical protein